MSRRPLGASLPPAERLVAYEAVIRDLRLAIGRVEDALAYADAHGTREGYGALRRAILELQVVNERPIRRRETVGRA